MAFPDTRHSAISGLHDEDGAVRCRCMEAVTSAYWEPVRRYISMRWRESEEDSADLTQAFFSKCLQAGTLIQYEQAKGTFRTYLRTCLDHFVLSARKKARTRTVPLEVDVASSAESPEEVFHREWVRSLFSLATEDLRTSGNGVRFGIFERYDLQDSERRPTYDELAAEFGVTTASVTNYLAAMRREFRKAVLNRLRELTVTDREFRAEARAILGIEV